MKKFALKLMNLVHRMGSNQCANILWMRTIPDFSISHCWFWIPYFNFESVSQHTSALIVLDYKIHPPKKWFFFFFVPENGGYYFPCKLSLLEHFACGEFERCHCIDCFNLTFTYIWNSCFITSCDIEKICLPAFCSYPKIHV